MLKALQRLYGSRLAASSKEDSPDCAPSAAALRSMHTGQNSIAPENSLPQLGQVRWGSVLMLLIAVQSQPQWNTKPRSTERCETEQRSAAAGTFVLLMRGTL